MRTPLVEPNMIMGTEHGQVTIPVRNLAHGEKSWDEVSMLITNEYAHLVDSHPEYEFGILADNLKNTLQITWKKRT